MAMATWLQPLGSRWSRRRRSVAQRDAAEDSVSAPRPLRTRRRSLPELDDVGSRRCGVAMQMVFGCSGRMRLVPSRLACVRRTAAFETNFCAHWRAGRIGGQCERQRRALQRLKPLARGRKRKHRSRCRRPTHARRGSGFLAGARRRPGGGALRVCGTTCAQSGARQRARAEREHTARCATAAVTWRGFGCHRRGVCILDVVKATVKSHYEYVR